MLPIGGLKEKILAARRAGVETVIVPKENRKDIEEDVPSHIRSEMKIEYVDDVAQVLSIALEPKRKGRAAQAT